MKEVGTLAAWVLGYVVGQPGRRRRDHQGRVGLSDGAVHQLHLRRPALPDALRHPGGVAAHRADAAAVPCRRSRATPRRWWPTSALGARLSAVALIPITAGFIVLGPSLRRRCCVRRDVDRRGSADRYRRSPGRRSACSRSRSSCCSCGCSTRCATAGRRRSMNMLHGADEDRAGPAGARGALRADAQRRSR